MFRGRMGCHQVERQNVVRAETSGGKLSKPRLFWSTHLSARGTVYQILNIVLLYDTNCKFTLQGSFNDYLTLKLANV